MDFLSRIKKTIGPAVYYKLEKIADIEVSLALNFSLKDTEGNDNYYRPRFLIPDLLAECELFERCQLNISPVDVVNILFKCKLLFACNSEPEYRIRAGNGSFVDEVHFLIPWDKKVLSPEAVRHEYFERLNAFIIERTLLVEISSFHNDFHELQSFFDKIFQNLRFPFKAFINESQLVELRKKYDPKLITYSVDDAKRFFNAPSIAFTTSGSSQYSFWYASAWLRTFLSLLKISGFIHPGQIEFTNSEIDAMVPTFPTFLGTNAKGGYCWDEDKKEPWEKFPDGCLWRSHGYRTITKIWLDNRNFNAISKHLISYKSIFEIITNPWNKRYLSDIAPTLDILCSATHIQELGAKILLIYCCLEHLFVPLNVRSGNKKYILGGIHALNSEFIEWFDRLYKLRCDYAHKGFVKREDKTLKLVFESISNILELLKLKINSNRLI
ncbi:MAG: hypothetical protein K9N22_10535 [Candidatus Marinimicrobia bacterium]|nr:hypothetical protein [Candidatus Neomarinimicrobiota bacterium]MCF7903119.1 hypothetical protein [Candidatus Neomarinimicrobiota bacterium]